MLRAERTRGSYNACMSFQRAEKPVVLKGMEAARAFFSPCVAGARSGEWWIAHVDEQVRCIHLAAYPAEGPSGDLPVGAVLGDAARLGSAGLLMASRVPGPGLPPETSYAAAARHLALGAEALDVTLLDHLVFHEGDCLSVRGAGFL